MSLKNFYGEDSSNRAYLVAVALPGEEDTIDRSLDELEDLALTCGFGVVGRVTQNLSSISGATFIGSGKLAEISELAQNADVDHLIFNTELSAAQFRNIAKETTAAVHDRTGVILEIFSDHARTDEGKIQVELARLRYRLTRLAGKGTELSRLGGGIGTRGPGESKLEQDRRAIQRRMSQLQKELDQLEIRRKHQRSSRQRKDALVAAVVGYTNAGKSTLMNQLCNTDIPAADRLFMTLDPTARKLELRDGISFILIDTVGFIREMPKHLKQAFKATLEEVVEADLILHLIDVSDREAAMHRQVVDEQLSELGAGAIDTFYIPNKIDKKSEEAYHDIMMSLRRDKQPHIYEISALTGEGIAELEEAMALYAESKMLSFTAQIPYSSSELEAYVREFGVVDEITYESEYMRLEGKLQKSRMGPVADYLVD
ncbi:MAG: GTPase HflX [Eubacteriales bacterium]|nr:GTPase HflX [Eubacteriales bacterium]